ncbi:MAG TPA: cyclic-phosphate processing receiver domain-containing protein [Pirellulales bacterium]
MNLWLDDVRPMPSGFDLHVVTAAQAIAALATGGGRKISLDHDLGDAANGSGYEVAKWIEERAFAWSRGEVEGLAPLEWAIHSQNVVGVENMRRAMQSAERFWSRRADDPNET